MGEEKEKGFTIKDRRGFDAEGNPIESSEDKQKAPDTAQREATAHTHEETSSRSHTAPVEINFSSFVLSLSSSALYHFGEIPDPITNKKLRNLLMAKQTIDILAILKEKTAGNLTQQEEALLNNLLYDLRMRYVKEADKDKTNQ